MRCCLACAAIALRAPAAAETVALTANVRLLEKVDTVIKGGTAMKITP